MNGRELQKEQLDLGVTAVDLCSEAGISITTLYKVYNDTHVRATTVSKVRNALIRIRNRVMGSKPMGRAIVG